MAQEYQQYTKQEVRYRMVTPQASKRCGNCAMFHRASKSCDIVNGTILPQAVCNKWITR